MRHRSPSIAIPTAYPANMQSLDAAEGVLLAAIRWWVAGVLRGEDPVPLLCRDLSKAGAHDAAFSIAALMHIVLRTVQRPIAIHCPRCPNLSTDETHLLRAAGLAQADAADLAERALRTALLSAQGAEFALGPLLGLGSIFIKARLIFRCHKSPAEPERVGVVEAWAPSTFLGPAH